MAKILRGSFALSAALMLGAGGGAARAASVRTSSLSWVRLEGAEECLGARELAESVERLLGRPIFVPHTRAEAVIEGRAERRLAGGFRAVVTMTRPDGSVVGTRELESAGPSCAELEEPLALSIAVMIDPDATPPRPAPVAAAPSPGPPWRWGAQLGPGVGLGQLPGGGLGAQLVAEIEPPAFWPIELRAALGVGGERAEGPSGAVRMGLAYVGVALCPAHGEPAPWLLLYGCLGPRVGALRAEGRDLDEPARRERFYAEVAASGRALVRLGGPFVASVGVSLGVPFWRSRYTYVEADGRQATLFRASALHAGADVGVGFFFR